MVAVRPCIEGCGLEATIVLKDWGNSKAAGISHRSGDFPKQRGTLRAPGKAAVALEDYRHEQSPEQHSEHGSQYRHAQPEPQKQRGRGRIRSSLRRFFGRREAGQHGAEEEWYFPPESVPGEQGAVGEPSPAQVAQVSAPTQWTLPSPTEESLRRAEASGFVTAAGLPPGGALPSQKPPASPIAQPPEPRLEPAVPEPQALPSETKTHPDLPQWVISEYVGAEATETSSAGYSAVEAASEIGSTGQHGGVSVAGERSGYPAEAPMTSGDPRHSEQVTPASTPYLDSGIPTGPLPSNPTESESPYSVLDTDRTYRASEASGAGQAGLPAPEGPISASGLDSSEAAHQVVDASFTILERNTQPIGGYLVNLGVEEVTEEPKAEQPPASIDGYRFSKEPDRNTLEAVYLPASPPEPLPGTAEAFSSVEQPAPPEPPPPPPIAVAKSTGSFEAVDGNKRSATSAPGPSSQGEEVPSGKIGQKRHGPPAFAAEPDVRHVVLGFKDGTAVFLEPEHPLFSLFFQWSELVAGPETPPKAYARRQAQRKIYLGKPPRGKPKRVPKKKANG